jgi:hypothetical protein
MDLLRHGAMPALLGGVQAPSTLGSFLRSFAWWNVLQLGKVSRLLLAELARRAPLLPGKQTLAFISDAQQKRVYGHHKQGAAFGHAKITGKSLLVRGLNALAATISTPLAAPVIAATGLRGGNAGSARGAARFAAQAVATARAAGCAGYAPRQFWREGTCDQPTTGSSPPTAAPQRDLAADSLTACLRRRAVKPESF